MLTEFSNLGEINLILMLEIGDLLTVFKNFMTLRMESARCQDTINIIEQEHGNTYNQKFQNQASFCESIIQYVAN